MLPIASQPSNKVIHKVRLGVCWTKSDHQPSIPACGCCCQTDHVLHFFMFMTKPISPPITTTACLQTCCVPGTVVVLVICFVCSWSIACDGLFNAGGTLIVFICKLWTKLASGYQSVWLILRYLISENNGWLVL